MIPVAVVIVLIALLVIGVRLLERRVDRACHMSPSWLDEYRTAQQRKGPA